MARSEALSRSGPLLESSRTTRRSTARRSHRAFLGFRQAYGGGSASAPAARVLLLVGDGLQVRMAVRVVTRRGRRGAAVVLVATLDGLAGEVRFAIRVLRALVALASAASEDGEANEDGGDGNSKERHRRISP